MSVIHLPTRRQGSRDRIPVFPSLFISGARAPASAPAPDLAQAHAEKDKKLKEAQVQGEEIGMEEIM